MSLCVRLVLRALKLEWVKFTETIQAVALETFCSTL